MKLKQGGCEVWDDRRYEGDWYAAQERNRTVGRDPRIDRKCGCTLLTDAQACGVSLEEVWSHAGVGIKEKAQRTNCTTVLRNLGIYSATDTVESKIAEYYQNKNQNEREDDLDLDAESHFLFVKDGDPDGLVNVDFFKTYPKTTPPNFSTSTTTSRFNTQIMTTPLIPNNNNNSNTNNNNKNNSSTKPVKNRVYRYPENDTNMSDYSSDLTSTFVEPKQDERIAMIGFDTPRKGGVRSTSTMRSMSMSKCNNINKNNKINTITKASKASNSTKSTNPTKPTNFKLDLLSILLSNGYKCCNKTFINRDTHDPFSILLEKSLCNVSNLEKELAGSGVIWGPNAIENHDCRADQVEEKIQELNLKNVKLKRTLQLAHFMKKNGIVNFLTLATQDKPFINEATKLYIGDVIEINSQCDRSGQWRLTSDVYENRVCYQWVKCNVKNDRTRVEMSISQLMNLNAKLIAFQISGDRRSPADLEIVYLINKNVYGVVKDDLENYEILIVGESENTRLNTKKMLDQTIMLLLNGEKLEKQKHVDYTGVPCHGHKHYENDEMGTIDNNTIVKINKIEDKKYYVTVTDNVRNTINHDVYQYENFMNLVYILRPDMTSGSMFLFDNKLPRPIEERVEMNVWFSKGKKGEVDDDDYVDYLQFKDSLLSMIQEMKSTDKPIAATKTTEWQTIFAELGAGWPEAMFTKPQYTVVVKWFSDMYYDNYDWTKLDKLNITRSTLVQCVMYGVYGQLFDFSFPKAKHTPDDDSVRDALMYKNNSKSIDLCLQRELQEAHIFANWLNKDCDLDEKSIDELMKEESYSKIPIYSNVNLTHYVRGRISGFQKWSVNTALLGLDSNPMYYHTFSNDNFVHFSPTILTHSPLRYLIADNLTFLQNIDSEILLKVKKRFQNFFGTPHKWHLFYLFNHILS